MACTSQRRLLPSPRVLYLSLLIILASTCSSSATPTKPKSGLLDKIIYVSEDPAIQRWRSEISGAGIYPAHYALKAIDLLPTRNAPVRYMRARERRSRRSNIVIDDSLGLHKAVVHAPTRRGQIEARRRRKKGKGKDRDGHDEKGYDDGSWRGKNGDYGSVKKGGKDDTETEDYGQESEYEDEYQQGAPSKYSDDVRETDGEDLRDDEENGYSTAEEGSSSAFQPGKQKSKFKSDYEEDENAGMGISEDGWRAPGPSKSSTDPSESNIDNESKWKDNDVPRDKGYYGSESNRSGQDVDDGKTTYDGPRSTDCEALKTFYDDMGGHEWTDSTGWTSTGTSNSPSCCRAYGVSCNSVGRVTALDLGQNGLSGSLSLSIFELRYLSRLNLSVNAISGEIPDKFDTLPRLSTIYIDQNKLKGSLPPTLQDSSSISSVHISNNSLEGTLIFPNARNLTQLYAARNRLTNVDISTNSALIKVALDDNQFNCTLPDIAAFTNLQVFSVARNHFAGSPPIVEELQQLVKLDLQANNLSGTFPDVTALPRLQYLGLNGNSDLSGPFPTGKAPPNLITCHVDTLLATSCPAQSVMDDPDSLAAKCSLNCRGGGKPANATPNSAAADNVAAAEQPTDEKQTLPKQRLVNASEMGQTPASLADSLSKSGNSCRGRLPSLYLFLAVPVLMYLN